MIMQPNETMVCINQFNDHLSIFSQKIFAFFLILSTMLFAGWRQPVVSEKHLHNKSTFGGVSDIST